MADYRNNRGVYSAIHGLNTIPTEYDLAMQQQQEGYDVQADLDLFMNTQLFDFEMGTTATENNSPSAATFPDNDILGMMAMKHNNSSQQPQQQQQLGVDFQYPTDFNMAPNFHTLPSNVPQQPHHQAGPAPLPQHMHSHLFNASVATSSTSTPPTTVSSPISDPQPGSKRKVAPSSEPSDYPVTRPSDGTPEDAARYAAEEDKRKRNTAASARFRVKKKQREAQLEKTAKEMTDKVRLFEAKVAQLEMENRLLKELVTEKRGEEEVKGVEARVRELQKGVKSER
jgi:hypothetical protein